MPLSVMASGLKLQAASSVHPKSGLQASIARSRALRTFKRPPVTVSPTKLSTTSTPSKMKPRTASAATWGVTSALDARSAQGAL